MFLALSHLAYSPIGVRAWHPICSITSGGPQNMKKWFITLALATAETP